MGNPTIYTIQKNDSPWAVATKQLKVEGKKVSNDAIVKEMQRLAKLNGCDSVDDFSAKFFNKVGAELIVDDKATTSSKKPMTSSGKTISERTIIAKRDSTYVAKTESVRVAEKLDNARVRIDSTRVAAKPDSIRVARKDSVQSDSVIAQKFLSKAKVDPFQVESARINRIKGDKNRIIEYNKTHATGNYVIVDKKTCQATVYNKQGKPLKSYEVILGATKGDDLSTAFADDKKLAHEGRRTVPGEFKLGDRKSTFGGLRATGDAMETFDPDVKLREWAPGQQGKQKFGVAFQAMHGTADRANRDKYYNNGKLSDNRQSLGCVNIPVHALDEMEQKFGIGTGSSLYILPETKGNELVLTKRKDGEVKFMTHYKNEAQNAKQKKIQDAIANKNIKRNLAAKQKAEKQRLLAEQKRKEAEFSIFKPGTWFA